MSQWTCRKSAKNLHSWQILPEIWNFLAIQVGNVVPNLVHFKTLNPISVITSLLKSHITWRCESPAPVLATLLLKPLRLPFSFPFKPRDCNSDWVLDSILPHFAAWLAGLRRRIAHATLQGVPQWQRWILCSCILHCFYRYLFSCCVRYLETK